MYVLQNCVHDEYLYLSVGNGDPGQNRSSVTLACHKRPLNRAVPNMRLCKPLNLYPLFVVKGD